MQQNLKIVMLVELINGLRNKFKNVNVKYVNAGVGATGSIIGLIE
mgnify:CR=1 FL=1